MTYPADAFFDIETLINVAQPKSLLLIGDYDPTFTHEYLQQKSLLRQACDVTHISNGDFNTIWQDQQHYDVAIALGIFEHINKQQGRQLLSRLRDVLSKQYCVCLPLSKHANDDGWQLTDLFSFALQRVAEYQYQNQHFGLFKYDLHNYKSTPDWLNADNWANPQMWGKYRW